MASERNAIVFDLDGTLVDTAADLAAAANEALGAIGRPALELDQVRGMIGGGFPNFIERGLLATGGRLADREFENVVRHARAFYREHVADHSAPYPEVLHTLAELRHAGIRMGVCTNKPAEPSRKLLAALGLDAYLPVLVGGDTLGVMKPEPAVVDAALQGLEAKRSETVLVGDSEIDQSMGAASGIPVILVSYGYGPVVNDGPNSSPVIDRFSELPAVITGLP